MKRKFLSVLVVAVAGLAFGSFFAQQPGESGALGSRLDQASIVQMSVSQAAAEGQRIFTTPFNKLDGYGDGPHDPVDTISPGGRPTLQGNGTLLRINGMDAQACFECHTLVSNATVPATLGIGGAGGTNANAIFQPSHIDPADLDDPDGAAAFNGRFINPPFVFGVGGVELVGLEMTADLQALKLQAINNPFTPVSLVTKGVSFGTIVADALGKVDTSGVEGVSGDLVIRPFGRKGDNATTRDFDTGAMMFHFGMQPTEVVGVGVDGDDDGITDEITVGELSALGVFLGTLPRPRQGKMIGSAPAGEALFASMGCAGCHTPFLDTNSKDLPLRFPQVPTDPSANIYKLIDLTKMPADFDTNANGGVRVPMFADLKRHDMGSDLAEDFALADAQTNAEYTTAKLWGVVDSGPWLHDGRALTITDAILLHGGEAIEERDAFAVLSDDEKVSVLTFLRTLQTPKPNNAGGNNNPRRRLRPGTATTGSNEIQSLSSHQ
jgi:hypothetical protein